MEENLPQVSHAPQISQQPEIQVQSPKPWLKIILIVILGLILACGLIYAGVQIGKKQVQISAYPTPTPTAQTERIDCQTDSDCVLVINKKQCCSCPQAVNKEELNKNKDLIKYPKITLEVIPTPPGGCKDIVCSPCPWWNKAVCESGLCKGVADLTSTPSSVSTSTPDQAAEWKTYTNEQGGFTVKFPSDYSTKPRTNGVGLLKLSEGKDTEKIIIERDFAGGWACTQVISSEEIFIDKEKGKLETHATMLGEDNCSKIDPSGSHFATVFVTHKGTLWFFHLGIDKSREVEEIVEFKQILSTFRFD